MLCFCCCCYKNKRNWKVKLLHLYFYVHIYPLWGQAPSQILMPRRFLLSVRKEKRSSPPFQCRSKFYSFIERSSVSSPSLFLCISSPWLEMTKQCASQKWTFASPSSWSLAPPSQPLLLPPNVWIGQPPPRVPGVGVRGRAGRRGQKAMKRVRNSFAPATISGTRFLNTCM